MKGALPNDFNSNFSAAKGGVQHPKARVVAIQPSKFLTDSNSWIITLKMNYAYHTIGVIYDTACAWRWQSHQIYRCG